MAKFLVLGSNGMLGRYMFKYLHEQNHTVLPYTRKQLDAFHPEDKNFEKLASADVDIVINCTGLIKQRKDISTIDMIQVNSIFPLELAEMCEHLRYKFVHITTDCVFDGFRGGYDESDSHCARDVYGKTKSLGEPENATVIRTSIIGEELQNKLSLVEWVKSQAGKACDGYLNHFWNGVTCLQLAKIVEEVVEEDLWWKGVRHIFSPVHVSKYDLVDMINKAYGLEIDLKLANAKQSCDRTLKSNHDEVNLLTIPDLWEQIKEMKEFKLV